MARTMAKFACTVDVELVLREGIRSRIENRISKALGQITVARSRPEMSWAQDLEGPAMKMSSFIIYDIFLSLFL